MCKLLNAVVINERKRENIAVPYNCSRKAVNIDKLTLTLQTKNNDATLLPVPSSSVYNTVVQLYCTGYFEFNSIHISLVDPYKS